MLKIYVQTDKDLSVKEVKEIKKSFDYTGKAEVIAVPDNAHLFHIPSDMGMDGFAVFMQSDMKFIGDFHKLLHKLGEEMYLYDEKGKVVVWNCSHAYCRQCLNGKNLKDVRKNFHSYMQNYFPMNTDALMLEFFEYEKKSVIETSQAKVSTDYKNVEMKEEE